MDQVEEVKLSVTLHAENHLAMAAKEEKDWKKIEEDLWISEKYMNKLHRRVWCGRFFFTTSYLFVIFGCELDFFGFLMAFSSYWNIGFTIVRLLLVVCPFVFVLAVGIYRKKESFRFLPIFRYYSYSKWEHSDVEGVFIVNALSSFSIGVAIMFNNAHDHLC